MRSQGEHSPAIIPAGGSIKNSISSSLDEQVVKPPRVFHVVDARKTGQPTELISLKSSDLPDEPRGARSGAAEVIQADTSRDAQEAAMYITERSHEQRVTTLAAADVSPMKETNFVPANALGQQLKVTRGQQTSAQKEGAAMHPGS